MTRDFLVTMPSFTKTQTGVLPQNSNANSSSNFNENELIFIQFQELNTVYKINLNSILKLKTGFYNLNNKIEENFTIQSWTIKANLELQTGIMSHLFHLYRLTGEEILENEELFLYLQFNKLIQAKINVEWKNVLIEAYNKYNDSGDLQDFYFGKIQENFKKKIEARNRLKNRTKVISSFDEGVLSDDQDRRSESSLSSKEEQEDQNNKNFYPSVKSNIAASLILLTAARQGKTNLLKYFTEKNNDDNFLLTYRISVVDALNVKSMFGRTILHMLALAGKSENLEIILKEFERFPRLVEKLRVFSLF